MRFGFCSSTGLDADHGRCPHRLLIAMGVQEGQVAVCDCPCHAAEAAEPVEPVEDVAPPQPAEAG